MNLYKNKFEVCVRGAIFDKGRILVCRNKKKGYYFFPGGHLKFGERVGDALARELREELGARVKRFSFIGVVDNIFKEDDGKHHEVSLVFRVKTRKASHLSQEKHIDFVLLNKREFAKAQVYPIALKKAILKWLKEKKVFWSSQYL